MPCKSWSYPIQIFTHLKLCVATVTSNFKWVKINDIYLIWNKKLANFEVQTLILFPKTVIWSANKTIWNDYFAVQRQNAVSAYL